ncbi:MAG: RIP metalloprotease RseP [bacterium]|nr:RIP metalloprotease RseP [bacterium]
MTVLIFLIVFSVLVFVHEFGHFITAKKQGITVEEFGFGFPPRLLSKIWRGTRYSLNAIPLGGFVRIKGEEGEEAGAPDSFSGKPIWQRAIVIVAGVFMNVLLGWALLTGGFIVGMPSIVDDTIPSQYVRDRVLIIRSLLPNAPVETTDFRVDDVLTNVEGKTIKSVRDLQEALADRDGKETSITVERDHEAITRTVTPRYIPEAKRVGIGIGLDEVGIVRYPFFTALQKGVTATGFILKEIVVSFANLIREIVVTRKVSADLSGPIGIAVLTGQVARRGIAHLFQFTALLSLNLAVLNILPIPALDGGRLLFLAIEKIRRRAFKKTTENRINKISFILLLLLVFLVTYRDVVKFFSL